MRCQERPDGIPTDWPVEVGSERRPLGLDGKDQIEEYGLEPFIQ